MPPGTPAYHVKYNGSSIEHQINFHKLVESFWKRKRLQGLIAGSGPYTAFLAVLDYIGYP
jgi:hypothetical protein